MKHVRDHIKMLREFAGDEVAEDWVEEQFDEGRERINREWNSAIEAAAQTVVDVVQEWATHGKAVENITALTAKPMVGRILALKRGSDGP